MAKRRKRKRVAYRSNVQNRYSMFLITMVVMVLLVIVGVGAYGMVQKRDALRAERDENAILIEQEEQRAKEIEEYGKYTKTLKYYEEQARLRLGLMYENEYKFVPED